VDKPQPDMTRKDQAERFLRQGLLPSQIAAQMGISTASVIQYLRTGVGEGSLRFSEIYFSWPASVRESLQAASDEIKTGKRADSPKMRATNMTREDVDFYRSIRHRRVFAGDLYEHVAEAELALHDMVWGLLKDRFGDGETGYWRQGIPVGIRKRCHERREDDNEPSDSAFQYTTLIELAEIISKNWSLFQAALPKEHADNRRDLARDFDRLNRIRNTVMHPVKRRRWSEDDFEFVRRIRLAFEKFRAT